MITSLGEEQTFDKIQSLYDKCSREIMDTRNISKHNKGSLQQADSQRYLK